MSLLFQNVKKPEHWKWINEKILKRTINGTCTHAIKDAVLKLNAPFVHQDMMRLYDPGPYLDRNKWQQFMAVFDTLECICVEASEHYVDWWLKGNRLPRDANTRQRIRVVAF